MQEEKCVKKNLTQQKGYIRRIEKSVQCEEDWMNRGPKCTEKWKIRVDQKQE